MSKERPGISEHRDGWLGEPCKNSECHKGEIEGEYGPRACGICGGTGEAYDPLQDDRRETNNKYP